MTTTTAAAARCTGEPVSWLRLEQHALAPDAAVARHLEECAACRACLAGIESESERGRALPALGDVAVAAAARRRRRRRAGFLGSAAALAAAAVVLLAVLGRREGGESTPGIKGGERLTVGLVRERAGEVALDPTSFRAGDRFKVLVTCARPGPVEVAVTVAQAGATFTPLEPGPVGCGNRVPLPGAFSLTGDQPATVCARIAGDVACAALAPEP